MELKLIFTRFDFSDIVNNLPDARMNCNSSRIADLLVEQNLSRLRVKIGNLDRPFSGIRPEDVPGLPIDGNTFRKVYVFFEKDFHIFSVVAHPAKASSGGVCHV